MEANKLSVFFVKIRDYINRDLKKQVSVQSMFGKIKKGK